MNYVSHYHKIIKVSSTELIDNHWHDFDFYDDDDDFLGSVVMCCVDNHWYDLDFHDDDDDFLGSVVFTESRLRLGTQPLGRD